MRTALGDLDGAQVRAGAEGAVVDNSQGRGCAHGFQLIRLVECTIPDIRQGVREGDGLRILAAAENAALDARHRKFLHAGGYLHIGHRGELFGHDGVVGVEAEGQILCFELPRLEVVALELLMIPRAEQLIHHVLQLHAVTSLEQKQVLLTDISAQSICQFCLRGEIVNVQRRVGTGFFGAVDQRR